MIDFRYHLVSIVAVFLALAIGIVLGTTALNGPLTSRLRSLEGTLRAESDTLRAQKNQLQLQIGGDQAFAQAAAPLLLPRLLEGQRVALVSAPGASPAVISGITAAVKRADGTVTGQVSLQPQFFDTSATTEHSLTALAQLAPPGTLVTGPGSQQLADPQISGQIAAAAAIAAAIVTKDGPTLSSAQTHAILAGFAQGGFLQASPPVLAPATLAVVIIPATPPTTNDAAPANLALISMTQKLSAASDGALMAGSIAGSGPGSAIDELASGNTGIEVSSVDNADSETGQIMVVQALNKLLTGHKPANYGAGPGTAPSPAPTPSPSLTPVPSTTGRASKHGVSGPHHPSATPGPSVTPSPSVSLAALR
jgi:hypothetical protein